MKMLTCWTIILPIFGCFQSAPDNVYKTIGDIPPPPGFTTVSDHDFGRWLQKLPLKKNNTVYLYNKQPKRNQLAHVAVLDIPVGNKNLQQCADAVMRLRATYFFTGKQYDHIRFYDNNGRCYQCPVTSNEKIFEQYLEKVFVACGTLSLEKQLKPVKKLQDIQAGDVFIKGGSPGHALIVVAVAANAKGNKMYMLAQSYMPAQEIELLKNPTGNSPWYSVREGQPIETPEWTFLCTQLKRW
jgi:hypothetical protein